MKGKTQSRATIPREPRTAQVVAVKKYPILILVATPEWKIGGVLQPRPLCQYVVYFHAAEDGRSISNEA